MGPFTRYRGVKNPKHKLAAHLILFKDNWAWEQWLEMDSGSIWFEYNAWNWNNLPEGAD